MDALWKLGDDNAEVMGVLVARTDPAVEAISSVRVSAMLRSEDGSGEGETTPIGDDVASETLMSI